MKRIRGEGPQQSIKQKLWTSRLHAIVDFSLESRGNDDESTKRSHPEVLQIEKRKWRQIDLGDHLFGGFEVSSGLDLSPVWKYIGILPFN